MGAAAAVGSHTSVQLHATEVVAELVANISRGECMYTVPTDTACPAASQGLHGSGGPWAKI